MPKLELGTEAFTVGTTCLFTALKFKERSALDEHYQANPLVVAVEYRTKI